MRRGGVLPARISRHLGREEEKGRPGISGKRPCLPPVSQMKVTRCCLTTP